MALRVATTRHYLTIGVNHGRALPMSDTLVRHAMIAWNWIACRIWGHWWLPTVACPFGAPHQGECLGCGKRDVEPERVRVVPGGRG